MSPSACDCRCDGTAFSKKEGEEAQYLPWQVSYGLFSFYYNDGVVVVWVTHLPLAHEVLPLSRTSPTLVYVIASYARIAQPYRLSLSMFLYRTLLSAHTLIKDYTRYIFLCVVYIAKYKICENFATRHSTGYRKNKVS